MLSRMSTLRVADFVIDGPRHLLLRGDQPIDLSPRLVDVLGHLAENTGHVVSKEVLLDRHWPNVHITDEALAFGMTQIRKAIGDETTNPRFIQTVSWRGYRFVARVVVTGQTKDYNALAELIKAG